MNVLDVERFVDGHVIFERSDLGIGHTVASILASAARSAPVSLGVRPEDVKIAGAGEPGLDCEVALVQLLDNETLVTFQRGDQRLMGRFDAEFEPKPGTALRITFRETRLHTFLRESGEAAARLANFPARSISRRARPEPSPAMAVRLACADTVGSCLEAGHVFAASKALEGLLGGRTGVRRVGRTRSAW